MLPQRFFIILLRSQILQCSEWRRIVCINCVLDGEKYVVRKQRALLMVWFGSERRADIKASDNPQTGNQFNLVIDSNKMECSGICKQKMFYKN